MEPYRPLLLNDKDKKGVSRENYMNLIKMNPSRLVSQSVDAPLRQTAIKQYDDQLKNSYNLPLIHRIVVENQVLQAKLREEQNRAQLATNKYIYLQMMYKKMEYESLVEKEKRRYSRQAQGNNLALSHIVNYHEQPPVQINESMTDRNMDTIGEIRMRVKKVAEQVISEETPKVYQKKYFKNRKILSPEEVSAEVMKMKEKQQILENKQKLHDKLWAAFLRCYLIIRIVIKWSENVRKKRKIIEKNKQEQTKKAKGLFVEIKKCDEQTKKQQTQEWINKIVLKIFQAMMGEEMRKIFSQNFNPNHIEAVELQKKWLIYFSILFMKNLEMNTRDNKIPEIQCLIMTLQLYKFQDKQASLFVALRTQYLSPSTFELSEKEINLITSEYILFSVLIPSILELEQQQKYFNEQHKYQCRQLMFKIFSLLQLLFISQFYDMEQKKIIGKMKIVQKKIEVTENTLQMKFITEPKTDEEQVIIQGLEKKQKFETLFTQNKEAFQDLKSFLEIIISNIGKNAFI